MERFVFLQEGDRGYKNLVCDSVLSADVDFDSCPMKTAREYEEHVLKYSQANGLQFRIYHTYKGFRVICVSHHFKAASGAARRILESLFCDPNYIFVSKLENTFCVRVSPKPERIGVSNPHHPQDFDFFTLLPLEKEAWLFEYNSKNSGFRACKFLFETPEAGVAPKTIQNFIKLHDELSGALQSHLNLA